MNDIMTDDPMEFFNILTQLGNSCWGFAFRWIAADNGVRLPIYVFCTA